jgi:hypothetical protein
MKQLLITFSNRNYIIKSLRDILKTYELFSNQLFIFNNLDNRREVIFSYNIKRYKDEYQKPLPNTILVHRKKDTNTIYTINALNTLIMEINNGVLDKCYQISWENYQNMILLTTKNSLRRISIKLSDIINVDDMKN